MFGVDGFLGGVDCSAIAIAVALVGNFDKNWKAFDAFQKRYIC